MEIWDRTGQARAQVWQTELLESGERVEVAGSVNQRNGQISLNNSLVRRLPKAEETSESEELRLVAEVRELSQEEAASGRKVRLRGVVTWSHAGYEKIFVSDSSGGICVKLSAAQLENLPAPNREVELEGVTGFVTVPKVICTRLTMLGTLA